MHIIKQKYKEKVKLLAKWSRHVTNQQRRHKRNEAFVVRQHSNDGIKILATYGIVVVEK